MAITDQQIFDIADKLNREGVRPSIPKIREALGAGSFTTISAALNKWKETREEAREDSALPEPPESITARLSALTAHLWAGAQEQAQAELESDRQAWADERAKIEQERDEAIALSEQSETDSDALRNELKAKQSEYKEHFEQMSRNMTELENKLDESEQQRRQAIQREQKAQTTIEVLREQIAALIERIEPDIKPSKKK